MKRTLCLVLSLLLGVSAWAMAEESAVPGADSPLVLAADPATDEALSSVFNFLASNAADVQTRLAAEGRYAPLRAYKLEWPKGVSAMDETVAEAYGAYPQVYAIQYEIETLATPFTDNRYLAVGVGENGAMDFCAAPDALIARNYDPTSFRDCRVTLYKFAGIDRNAVAVYLPDANFDGLERFEAEGENSAVGLIFALEKANAVPAGTRVLGYDGETLDLSAEFGEAMAHTGTTGEYLMMGAVVNTFLENFHLERISVLSEGAIIETGHAIYDEPLGFYDANR